MRETNAFNMFALAKQSSIRPRGKNAFRRAELPKAEIQKLAEENTRKMCLGIKHNRQKGAKIERRQVRKMQQLVIRMLETPD
jgi:hypothetical protein